MKSVTAVEWLVEQLSSSKYIYKLMEEIECQSTIVQPNIFEQAKAMEKQQIIYANYNGQSIGKKLIDIDVHQMKTKAEHYYNEQFKNK